MVHLRSGELIVLYEFFFFFIFLRNESSVALGQAYLSAKLVRNPNTILLQQQKITSGSMW